MKKIFALFHARNLEFMRDKGAMGWNIIFPIFLVIGISLAFSNGVRPMFKVAVIGELGQDALFTLEHAKYFKNQDKAQALKRLQQHQYDLVIDNQGEKTYWVNSESKNGYFLDKYITESKLVNGYQKQTMSQKPIRYVDWVLPGILAINMLYSCLYGVGYAIVRYRRNGYLKRLQSTPVSALEFLTAQVFSRFLITLVSVSAVYVGCMALLHPVMVGSYLLLLLVAGVGSFSLISLSVIVCGRITSEELARGLMEMTAWPMLLISGAWFALDNAHPALQAISKILPLTHMIDAAREVMLYGAGIAQIIPQLMILSIMGIAFLLIGALTFKWQS